MNQMLVSLAIQEAPAVIDLLKTAFHKAAPDEPEPSNAQAIAAFNSAFASSLAKDDAWLAAHPEQ